MPKVRKAVIPAAGMGTRQYPASAAVPKAFFPLVDRDGVAKPVVQLIVEEAVDCGIEQICIVVQPGTQQHYRDYFRRMDEQQTRLFRGRDQSLLQSEKLGALGQRLTLVEQSAQQGFGHAVYQTRDFVGDEPFLLLLGDHVYISATAQRVARQLLDVFEQQPSLDALSGVLPTPQHLLHLFGTIRGSPIDLERGIYKAELIVEKPDISTARQKLATPYLPEGNYLCHFGLHVFSPRIFQSIEHLISNNIRQRGEIQLTAAQEHLRQQGENYWVSIVHGQRYDTGIPSGLIETQLALALSGMYRGQTCEAIARLLAMPSS